MYKIQLTTNDEQKESINFIVHTKYLKTLEVLQYTGGFLRFNISIVKRTRKKVDYRELAEWLELNVFYIKWMSLYKYFDIKI